jgi:M6 family metalloprotease-like protein
LAFLSAASIAALTNPTVAQIHPPAPGVKMPPSYYEELRKDRNAFQFKYAWLDKTRRIRETRERYITNHGFYKRDMLSHAQLRRMSVNGTMRVPVMCGKFSNTPSDPYPVSTLQTELFDGPFSPYTLTAFYQEISYGDLTVQGDVYGWTQMPNPDVYYEGGCNATCAQAPLEEFLIACLEDNDPNVDFGQYDSDGPDGIPNSGDDDGFVDFAAFVQPEEGGECGTTNIWSHRWTMTASGTGPWTSNDPSANGGYIQVEDYVIQPAYNCTLSGGGVIPIGVFCHEFGHTFGIPDLYDTDSSSEGLGEWCLMSSGNYNASESPSHMSIWTKNELGWTDLEVVSSKKVPYVINNIEFNNLGYRLDVPDERWRRSTDCPIAGSYSMSCGLTDLEGANRTWLHAGGYGNGWDEQMSRTFHYNGGSNPVTLQFDAKWDSEPSYDFTYVKIDVNGTVNTVATFNGPSPIASHQTIDLTPYLSGSGATDYDIIFHFKSDQLLSDAYGFPTVCSPFVVDNIALTGGGENYSTGFETREDGWWVHMSPPPEYFLVENRKPLGSDAYVHGGGGLAIYHVESSVLRTGQDAQTGGPTNTMPAGLILEQADGLNEMGAAGNRGDAGDPYPGDTGNTLFDNTTLPNSIGYNGHPNIVTVELISGNGDPMTANMSGGYPLPGIAAYSPFVGSSGSQIAMTIDGGVWVHGVTVDLVGPPTIAAQSVDWLGKDRIVAHFDLTGAPGGVYDLVVTNPVNGCTISVNAFAIDQPTAVEPKAPTEFALRQNYPNPCNPLTTISFDVSEKGYSTLAIYDVAGRLVRTLVDGELAPKSYAATWDGTDNGGRAVASGVYFYKLVAGDFQDVRKLTLLK